MQRRTLDGKRAIITGASSGIGRELAMQMAEQRASLVLVARREDRLRELQRRILAAAGGNGVGRATSSTDVLVEVVAGDITEDDCRQSAVAVARQVLGGLDILVNNAGISAHGRFADASSERLRRIMEVNFFAAVELSRVALPLLQQGREPLVVNIGSILGRRGIPFNSDYCASKFALVGWSEAVRPELARQGIGVLTVNPGTTETELFEHLIEQTAEIPWRQQRGTPATEVARAAIVAMERRKAEVVIGRQGRALLWLNRAFPGGLGRYLRRYG